MVPKQSIPKYNGGRKKMSWQVKAKDVKKIQVEITPTITRCPECAREKVFMSPCR